MMEQYLVSDRSNHIVKPLTWHEFLHGIPLRIAHHGYWDVVKLDRSGKGHGTIFNNTKGNWTSLEDRCGDFFTNKVLVTDAVTPSVAAKIQRKMKSLKYVILLHKMKGTLRKYHMPRR